MIYPDCIRNHVELDRLKEELGWLKLFFVACVAIDVSVVGWLSQNFRTADAFIMAGGLVVIVLSTAGFMYVNWRARRCIALLEDY